MQIKSQPSENPPQPIGHRASYENPFFAFQTSPSMQITDCGVSSRHSATFLFVYEVVKRKFPNSVISEMCGRNNRRKVGGMIEAVGETQSIFCELNDTLTRKLPRTSHQAWNIHNGLDGERRNNKLFFFSPPASQQKCHFFTERLVDSRRDVERVLERGGIEFPASPPTLLVTGEAKTKLNFFIFPRLKRHVREQSFCRERKTESMWNNLFGFVRCAVRSLPGEFAGKFLILFSVSEVVFCRLPRPSFLAIKIHQSL